MHAAGLLLTGGSSRRLGQDKATLEIGGATCAARVAAVLAAAADPVLEVGHGVSGLPSVIDDLPGEGPLAAMDSGWSALRSLGYAGPVVVLACDLPRLRAPLVRLVATWESDLCVVPVVDGRPQPLCARYSERAMERCASLVAGGARALRPLLETDVVWLGPEHWRSVADPGQFADVDTPRDLLAAEAALAP